MRITYDHLAVSSFLLWLDNQIQKKGDAFVNTNSKFYPTNNKIAGYYTYASPLGQICSDSSITGALQFTGVYLNNTFIGTGQSGFAGIDYQNSNLYFTSPVAGTLSGNYSIKDFNVLSINQPEIKLLFETQYVLRPKTATQTTITGLPDDAVSYPVIFVRQVPGGKNKPLAFGGLDETYTNLGLFVIADSLYKLDAVNGILRDAQNLYVPIVPNPNLLPFDALGRIKTNTFYYDRLFSGYVSSGQAAYISNVDINQFGGEFSAEMQKVNPNVYFSVIDIEMCKHRYPHGPSLV